MFSAMFAEQIFGYIPSRIYDIIADVLYFLAVRVYAECLSNMSLQMPSLMFI